MKFHSPMAMVAAGAAAMLVLAGCSGGGPAADGTGGSSSSGGTLTIGTIVDVKSFDPAEARIAQQLQYYQPVYDSLLRREPDGTLVPMLATKWEYNADKTVLTLTLRTDVTFTDGSTLDANAVKVSLDRFRTGNGGDASKLAQVSDVEAKDAATVVLTLSEPDPALLDYLGNSAGFIANPKAVEDGKIATEPSGSGPYELDKSATVAGSAYTFVKKEGYWEPSLQVYDKIVVKPITDTTAMLNALLSGQVNAAALPAKSAAQATGAGMNQLDYSTDWQGLIIFDRDGTMVPELKDVRVRQAINYAIDKKTLLEQVGKNFGAVTSQIFDPNGAAYDESLDGAYPYDPAKAKALMAEAGLSNGFSVKMPTGAALDPALTAAIGQNLSDIGIKVEWVNVANTDFVSSLVQGKFPMAWFSPLEGDVWAEVNYIIAPKSTFNPLHTTDPKVVELSKAIQTTSGPEQETAAQELNKYLVEQAWFAPFYRPMQIFFTDKNTSAEAQVMQAVPSIYNYAPKK